MTELELTKQENKKLRRYIGELEERLSLEKELVAVKVGGFNYLCTDCKEKFDVPGGNTTCPYCRSIKIRVID
jgi:Zn finger protein HypA/HybF involved in hydrogenase expression